MPNTQTLELSALFSGSSNDYIRVCKQIVDVLNEESGFVAIGHPAMAEQHRLSGRPRGRRPGQRLAIEPSGAVGNTRHHDDRRRIHGHSQPHGPA